VMPRPSARAVCAIVGVLGVGVACATTQFDRYLAEERWADAARVFSADSALRNDEHALYAAGVLYGTPGRPTFDPVIARDMLQRLLSRFPQSDRRADASQRLALLDEIVRARRDADAREHELTTQIDSLSADTRLLRTRLDSASAQGDQMRRTTSRLEAELRDREEQLRTLRRELQRLKEIDLKPRPPANRIKP
jgi:hypothetical protein